MSETPWLRPIAGGAAVDLVIRAQPGASRDAVVGVVEGALKVAITAPPVDGAANARLLRYLAKEVLHLAPSRLSVVSGERGRSKTIRVEAPEAEVRATILALLAPR